MTAEKLAAALEREFGEAVALDAGFDHDVPKQWWLDRASALSAAGWHLMRDGDEADAPRRTFGEWTDEEVRRAVEDEWLTPEDSDR